MSSKSKPSSKKFWINLFLEAEPLICHGNPIGWLKSHLKNAYAPIGKDRTQAERQKEPLTALKLRHQVILFIYLQTEDKRSMNQHDIKPIK